MKAIDFNITNIKDKYNFKDSTDFLNFLEKELKIKEKQKEEDLILLDEIDYESSGIEEEFKDHQAFVEFMKSAREQVKRRVERDNAGIAALKNDIEIVKAQANN